MVFPCTHWLNAAIDLGNDWGTETQWKRRADGIYSVSLFLGDREHVGKSRSLDTAAWELVQKLRPDPADRANP